MAAKKRFTREGAQQIGKKLGIVSIVEAQDDLDEVFARVNKDWSGVVVFPRTDRQICLNGEGLAQPARLRNEDVLQLVDEFENEEMATRITFHEPVSLLALSSILPGDFPAPVSPVEPEPDTGRFSEERNPDVADDALSGASNGPRLVFGYYTIMEIIVMAFGTLVTAAIIFFVLELV